MWQNSKTKNVTKLKKSKCNQKSKSQNVTKLKCDKTQKLTNQNLKYDKTKRKLKMWQKSQIGTNRISLNCDKTQK